MARFGNGENVRYKEGFRRTTSKGRKRSGGGRMRQRFSSSSSVAINSLTLGVLEAEVSTSSAFSSPSPSGETKVSSRTEKAKGFGTKSAQGLAKAAVDSRTREPDDCESAAEADASGAFAAGIRVFRRQRGQRIVRPAKCEATVSSERQDSQKNVILILSVVETRCDIRRFNFKTPRNERLKMNASRRVVTAAGKRMAT